MECVIALAYYSIPILLIYFMRKRRDLPFGWIFAMFGVFIVACGTTHLVSIYEIWHGAYWFSGAVKAVTALASVGTALMLAPLVPRALALRSPAELDRINHQLQASLAEKDQLLDLYTREHHVATTLQQASLPRELPAIYGLGFDAYYRAGAAEAEVGGDWYDVIDLGGGTVVLSVGDVAGRGVKAAVNMARIRQALRTMAFEHPDPAALLRAGDMVMRSEGSGAMATAFVCVYRQQENRLLYAAAGHPPAMMRLPDGTILELQARGMPLGFRRGRETPASAVDVPRGAVLVLYTDGLVEAKRNIEDGLERLKATIAEQAFVQAESRASFIVDAVAPAGVHDDVAVLVTSFQTIGNALQLEFPAVPAAARSVRTALDLFLRESGVSDEELLAVQISTGEAVMNAVEHPYGTNPGAVRVSARRLPDRVEVEVRDFGRWRESPSDDRGRGLKMMQKLCSEVSVDRGDEGSRVHLTVRTA
jgi:anti-sigma regulatory factor (Ser/Thr protein kinase)